MLFDTDVLIWLFRGNRKAARLIEASAERRLSVISYMELLQGARNKKEIQLIKNFLAEFSFLALPLTEDVGHRAMIYMEEYCLPSGMFLADALIAATAVENHLPLCSGNRKHYRAIQDLELKVFRP